MIFLLHSYIGPGWSMYVTLHMSYLSHRCGSCKSLFVVITTTVIAAIFRILHSNYNESLALYCHHSQNGLYVFNEYKAFSEWGGEAEKWHQDLHLIQSEDTRSSCDYYSDFQLHSNCSVMRYVYLHCPSWIKSHLEFSFNINIFNSTIFL